MSEVKNHPIEPSVTALKKLVSSIPDWVPYQQDINKYLDELLHLTLEMRPPRIMVVGRCKSGKSSLINAICGGKVAEVSMIEPQTGQAQWKTYYNQYDSREIIHILDTRGFQEQTNPLEKDSAETPLKSIVNAVNQYSPDLILFVCKASDVSSGVEGDLQALNEVYQVIYEKYSRKLPLICVLTHCDQLVYGPKWERLDNQAKLELTRQSQTFLMNHLVKSQKRSNFIDIKNYVVPTVTYAEYYEGECAEIDPEFDGRWNIETLVKEMLKYLPKETTTSMARTSKIKDFQRKQALGVVDTCSALSAVISLNPIPGISFPIIGAIQTIMVMSIGYLSGLDFSEETVANFIATAGTGLGANWGLTTLSGEAAKFIPGFGSVISVTTNTVATKAVGELAIKFFIDQEIPEK
ncbi:50S ribosome-binding GTPase [Planktothrix agardhii 1032]|uniref:GTPase n=2 Tax=Planktothrix agardhii TaxID=1160 RepID=UPI001D0AD003|nr:GTPase [Planktothrix agardhii]MCB8776081.1 50S ribosome-binding GTPase [Planktothrix agardhii 1031]MCF3600410.1 50S ribosome-binding GTPase [Planktothrix agardhii 1032]